MTSKASSDFGLYSDVWKKNDSKKWVLFLSAFGFSILGLACFYSLIRAYHRTTINGENISFESIDAEKLIRPIPVEEDGKEEFPRPFGMAFKEPVPSVFRVSSTTEKVTTISYPQIGRYGHGYQPRNIQDILRYSAPMWKAKSYGRMKMDGYQNDYTASNFNQYPASQHQFPLHQGQNFGSNQLSSNHDPFYAFKPQDPSDINLMATASVRFAPPPWKNMNRQQQFHKMYPNHQQMPHEHPHMNHFVKDKFPRPLVVTLNIFPMTERDKILMGSQYSGELGFIGKMIANREFETRSGSNMIIKVNLFPEAISSINIDREHRT